jgi:solute carrier family 10 (sodium/bile acid cotransporter), member 7
MAAAVLGFILPELGARGGPLRPETTAKAGVAIIFLLQGLSIPTQALRAGALRWKLHAATQLFIFAVFPLGVLLLGLAGGRLLPDEVRLGFIFLAVLPTTVSTCVVFTAAARGNVSGALFNAALANVAGVVITPLLAGLVTGTLGEGPGLLPMMTEIAMLLLAPLLIGQLARSILAGVWQPNRDRLGAASNIIILYMVFTAFANSVQSDVFAETGVLVTTMIVVLAAALFGIALAAASVIGHLLGFDTADRRAFLFCAPQKTLASGIPMGQILFAGNPALGLILLPLMVYHTVQLLGGASLAGRMASSPRA